MFLLAAAPSPSPVTLSFTCVALVTALLVADRSGWAWVRAVCKLGASACFVLTAWALGALATRYGQCVLAALMLGWVGDALLLSRRTPAFLGGLGAFLLAHGAYAAAFLSGPVSWTAMLVALAVAVPAGGLILRWLWPHAAREFKVPLLAYVVVILAMCVAAAGQAGAGAGAASAAVAAVSSAADPTAPWLALAGAVLFALSDIAVARDQFVDRAFVNRLWGLPTYYVAQLLLAWSLVRP